MSGILSAAVGKAVPAGNRALAGNVPSGRIFLTPFFEPAKPSIRTGLAATAAVRKYAANAAATSQEQAYQEDYRIEDVPWNAQLVNAVSLVGRLGNQIEVRSTANSQVAKCRIAVNAGKDKPASWFDLEIWGELAGTAAAELKKGDQVQVLGRLKANEWTGKDGNKRKSVCVVLNNISRVLPYNAMSQPSDPWSQDESQVVPDQPGYDDQTAGQPGWGEPVPQAANPRDAKWIHLLSSPSEYYDNRLNKRNPKAPDFKHKTTGEALWIESAPQHIKAQLEALQAQAI